MRPGFLLFVLAVAGASIPRAATAQSAVCRDGTYSYSQHRSGTCSHHGGVAEWLSGGRTATTRPAAPRPAARHTVQDTSSSAARPRATSIRYHREARGRCYTYTASARKRYVARSLCRPRANGARRRGGQDST